MFLSTLTKFGAGAGTVAGTIYLGDTLIDNSGERKMLKKDVGTIQTIDEIEILEALKGCRFDFVASWNSHKTYRAKKYHESLSKDQKEEYSKRMVEQVNQRISDCKPGASFSFSWNAAEKNFYRTEAVIG